MIKSFKCKYTQALFDGEYQKKFSQAVNALKIGMPWEDISGSCL